MRLFPPIAAFAIRLYATSAFAIDCDAANHSDMNDCSYKQFIKSDEELNLAYKQIIACLKPPSDAVSP